MEAVSRVRNAMSNLLRRPTVVIDRRDGEKVFLVQREGRLGRIRPRTAFPTEGAAQAEYLRQQGWPGELAELARSQTDGDER